MRRALVSAACLVIVSSCGSVALSPDGGSDGAAGATGSAGSGSAGAGGSAGANGTAGASGVAGADGTAGASGVAGANGSAGANGTAGHTGTAGASGTAGATGAAGHGACGPVCDIYCQYGNVPDAKGCPTCACNPAPVCSKEECGPAPAPVPLPYCTNVVQASCGRNADGKCVWTNAHCDGGVCPPVECLIACPYGSKKSASGCATCDCNRCPTGTHEVACPTIACANSCPNGYVYNADGCDSCQCRAAVTCVPTNASCAACQFGARKGPTGCLSCECEDPPAGCAIDTAAQ